MFWTEIDASFSWLLQKGCFQLLKTSMWYESVFLANKEMYQHNRIFSMKSLAFTSLMKLPLTQQWIPAFYDVENEEWINFSRHHMQNSCFLIHHMFHKACQWLFSQLLSLQPHVHLDNIKQPKQQCLIIYDVRNHE